MINEQQLASWASIGASTTPRDTYRSVLAALEAWPDLSAVTPDIFLQGSYCNDTNVHGDSDVDVVVRNPGVWGYDISALSANDVGVFNAALSATQYTAWDIRSTVRAALVNYYGASAVTDGKKCLKVTAQSGRMALDVVPALTYRRFSSPWTSVDGIDFVDSTSGRQIINYPKQHSANGSAKNADQRTGGMYKHVIRIIKNARTALYDAAKLQRGSAPSYFVECLLYNVPEDAFRKSTYRDAFVAVLVHLHSLTDYELASFTCQNGLVSLFGLTPEQWTVLQARALINALILEYF